MKSIPIYAIVLVLLSGCVSFDDMADVRTVNETVEEIDVAPDVGIVNETVEEMQVISDWEIYDNIGVSFEYPKGFEVNEQTSSYPGYATVIIRSDEDFESIAMILFAFTNTTTFPEEYDTVEDAAEAILIFDSSSDALGVLHQATTKDAISKYYLSDKKLGIAEREFALVQEGKTLHGHAFEIYSREIKAGYALRIMAAEKNVADAIADKFILTFETTGIREETIEPISVDLVDEVREERCADSDSGLDILVKGSVTKGEATYEDSCTDSNSLNEYYCSNNKVVDLLIECPCSDGQCVGSGWCSKTIYKGNYRYQGYVFSPNGTIENECIDSRKLKVIQCTHNRTYYLTNLVDCYEDYGELVCYDGMCLSPEYVGLVNKSSDCVDSSSSTQVYGFVTQGGMNFTDYCINSTSVKEYECIDNKVSFYIKDCPGDYACSHGICGGENCKNKLYGAVLGERPISNPASQESVIWDEIIYTDYCINNKTLLEYGCSTYGVEPLEINCSEQCLYDACRPFGYGE